MPYALTVNSHEGCVSAIQFGTRPFSVLISLLDLMYNICPTLAHPLCQHCGLLDAFFRTGKRPQESRNIEEGVLVLNKGISTDNVTQVLK